MCNPKCIYIMDCIIWNVLLHTGMYTQDLEMYSKMCNSKCIFSVTTLSFHPLMGCMFKFMGVQNAKSPIDA